MPCCARRARPTRGSARPTDYDNGRVERRFFYADDERKSIWFDSGEMILPHKR